MSDLFLTDAEMAAMKSRCETSNDSMLKRLYAEIVVRRFDAAATYRDLVARMLLWCPECGERHIDEGEFATKPHHTHACQHCGHCWRPAIGPTCGVQFLPGFKNEERTS